MIVCNLVLPLPAASGTIADDVLPSPPAGASMKCGKVAMSKVLWSLLTPMLMIICHLVPAASATIGDVSASPPPGSMKCGEVDIPYPFSIIGVSWDGSFNITCNDSFSPPRPFTGDAEIKNISLDTGEMRVISPMALAYNCITSFDSTLSSNWSSWNLTGTPFLVSPTQNVFTTIGCDTLAFLTGRREELRSYFSSCSTTCWSLDDAEQDSDSCSGLGCCQSALPPNLNFINVSLSNLSTALEFRRPCSYAFVAEKDWYNFSRNDLYLNENNDSFISRTGERNITFVLDWAIRDNGSCLIPPEDDSGASAKPKASACVSNNSYCVNATHGPGYLCNCSEGYTGNPYVHDGCKNINECERRKLDPAKYEKLYPCGSYSRCQDVLGNYTCKCNFGHIGDGRTEKGCRPIFPGYATAIAVTFVCVVLACFTVILLIRRKQKNLFKKNGGDIIKDWGINIFTKGQLKRMTNNYSKLIGGGNFGNVYKGTIDDNQEVAVKRCKGRKEAPQRRMHRREAERQGQELNRKEAFVKEISFQFKIKHANVVRLLGCCLETDVPILVFEFIPNGSLYDMLHGKGRKETLPLLKRLDIAVGSADALSYMHTHGEHNHVHGDIKTANILLNDELVPKVSDFGSSRLLSVDSYATAVAADRSYIDPVYMKTNRFTEKSDVYSFGMVLLELITRKTAMYDGNNSLPIDFVKHHKEGNGREMYDKGILSGGDALRDCHMECLDKIGTLAVRCLKEDVDERPTMAEVVEELKQVRFTAHSAEAELQKA